MKERMAQIPGCKKYLQEDQQLKDQELSETHWPPGVG